MRRIEKETGQQLEPRPATPIRDRQPPANGVPPTSAPVLSHSIVKSLAERRDHEEEADQKAENRGVIIGNHLTEGSDNPAEVTDKTLQLLKALELAHKAGNAAITADQINEWVYAAGTVAYDFWHERGLKSVFESPAHMLVESVLFWWQNKDDIYQQEEINTRLRSVPAPIPIRAICDGVRANRGSARAPSRRVPRRPIGDRI